MEIEVVPASGGVGQGEILSDARLVRQLVDRLLTARSETTKALAMPVAWAVSGALVGASLAFLFRWRLIDLIVAVLATAALSWFARGVARLVMASLAVLTALGCALVTISHIFGSQKWSDYWLEPCFLVAVVIVLFVAGDLGTGNWRVSRLSAIALDLAASVTTLGFAVVCHNVMSPVGAAGGVRFLLGAEDNAAWVNLVAHLPSLHGIAADTTTAQGSFGPVVPSYLALVRGAMGGLIPHHMAPQASGQVVLLGHLTVILMVPIVATLLAAHAFGSRRPLLVLSAWACATVVIEATVLVLAIYGFLSATLALVLVLAVVILATGGREVQQRHLRVERIVVLFAMFGAGAEWVPLIPLAGTTIALWCIVPIGTAALRGHWRQACRQVVYLLPAALFEVDLIQQYRGVVNPIGGGGNLLAQGGGTPPVSTLVEVAALVLLGVAWFLTRGSARRSSDEPRSLLVPVSWMAAYLFCVLASEAWLVKAPEYGSTKLSYIFFGIWLAVGAVEVLASEVVARREIAVAVGVILAVLLFGTLQQGPIYTAIADHWPNAAPPEVWLSTAENEAASGARVLGCIDITLAAPSSTNLDPYFCSRWSASLSGYDGPVPGDWRGVVLGNVAPSTMVTVLKSEHYKKPWTVIVIGPIRRIHKTGKWWSSLTAAPGLRFVHVPGTE